MLGGLKSLFFHSKKQVLLNQPLLLRVGTLLMLLVSSRTSIFSIASNICSSIFSQTHKNQAETVFSEHVGPFPVFLHGLNITLKRALNFFSGWFVCLFSSNVYITVCAGLDQLLWFPYNRGMVINPIGVYLYSHSKDSRDFVVWDDYPRLLTFGPSPTYENTESYPVK